MEKIFETQDLYLSAAIVTLIKTEPSYKIRNQRTSFCFTISDDLYRAMSDYNSDVDVPVQQFAGNLKRLRGEMLTRRNFQR